MTIHRNLNQAGLGGNYAAYYLKEILKAAGWKILDSGSGEDAGGQGNQFRVTASSVTLSITQQTPDATHMQVNHSGGGNFTAAMVGQYVDISGLSANNNVTDALVTAYIDADTIQVENATGGVTEAPAGAGSYEVHGDHFTSVAVGASDFFGAGDPPAFNVALGAGGCWWRAQDPSGNREIVVNRGSGDSSNYDGYWCHSYSKAAKFIGGSPNATTPPDATDEQVISSSGSKASPGNLHSSSGSTTLHHFAADDTPDPVSGEYGYIWLELVATNTLSCYGWLDNLQNVPTNGGDYHALTLAHGHTDLVYSSLYNDSANTAKTFVDNGGGGETWKAVEHLCPVGQAGNYPTVQGKVSKYDGKERPMIVPVCEPTVGGYLGVSRWLNWTAVQRGYPNTGDSFNVLYVSDVILLDLWDGATTPQAI